jgi:hypothetical protein
LWNSVTRFEASFYFVKQHQPKFPKPDAGIVLFSKVLKQNNFQKFSREYSIFCFAVTPIFFKDFISVILLLGVFVIDSTFLRKEKEVSVCREIKGKR